MKPSAVFLKKINQIDKPIVPLIKKRRDRTQINKIRNERGQITTDVTEIQKIIREYYEQSHANKLDNLEKMDKLPETYNLPRMNQEERDNLNRPITSSETEFLIKKKKKNSQQTKVQDQTAS